MMGIDKVLVKLANIASSIGALLLARGLCLVSFAECPSLSLSPRLLK